jgi:hypothetical protein
MLLLSHIQVDNLFTQEQQRFNDTMIMYVFALLEELAPFKLAIGSGRGITGLD